MPTPQSVTAVSCPLPVNLTVGASSGRQEKKRESLRDSPYDPAEVFSGPAVYANKSYITMTPLGLRLTFTEGWAEGKRRYRTAVFLNLLDAMAFKDLLVQQLNGLDLSVEPKVAGMGHPRRRDSGLAMVRRTTTSAASDTSGQGATLSTDHLAQPNGRIDRRGRSTKISDFNKMRNSGSIRLGVWWPAHLGRH